MEDDGGVLVGLVFVKLHERIKVLVAEDCSGYGKRFEVFPLEYVSTGGFGDGLHVGLGRAVQQMSEVLACAAVQI